MAPLNHLVLYDGACAVCNRAVQFLLDHDEGVFDFAPLQGTTAAGILQRHPELRGLDTLVYVSQPHTHAERVEVYSAAVFSIAALLPAPWRWVAAAKIAPRPVTDAAYRAFAATRYRLFGSANTCQIPLEHQLTRFHS